MGYKIPACECFVLLITALQDWGKRCIGTTCGSSYGMQNFLDKNSQFFFSFYFDKDLGVVCEKLTTAVKVLAKASIIYCWYIML